MRSRPAFRAFVLFSILMASSMGCIGLVPAREFMEDLRPSAKMIEEQYKINVDHTFTTVDPALFTYSEDFVVDEHVTEVSAYMSASIPLAESIPIFPPDMRYVEASLTDSEGTVVWSEKLTETENKMVASFHQPLAQGTWTLDVQARGYGEEVANLYKDSFQVLIKIERECWQYPNEEGCSYD